MNTVLVAGGTGYLGQFLVSHFAQSGLEVGFTYHTSLPRVLRPNVHAFKVDVISGEGVKECIKAMSSDGRRLVAVINCIAISQPTACQQDPDLAFAVNVPIRLLDALERLRRRTASSGSPQEPLFIQLSTDQVYEGSGPRWLEGDVTRPVNVYGESKLAAEVEVRERWRNHAILRSSIIYGPAPPVPVGRPLFLQFIDQVLAEQKPTAFFTDEFRSPIRVRDIVRICQTLIFRQHDLKHRLFNMGGPDRLSRADMAEAVAEACGYSTAAIVRAKASSIPREQRGAPSPPDISMDSSRIVAELGVELTPFKEALHHILNDHDHLSDKAAPLGGRRSS